MKKGLIKKIIIGSTIIGGLAGLTGCFDSSRMQEKLDEAKARNAESEYFSDKGLIYKFSDSEGASYLALAVGDMDGDGDNDLLLAKAPGGERGIKYFENLGNGKYVDKGLIYKFSDSEGASHLALAVGDMDGDGDNDIILAKAIATGRGVRYIENNLPQKNKIKSEK